MQEKERSPILPILVGLLVAVPAGFGDVMLEDVMLSAFLALALGMGLGLWRPKQLWLWPIVFTAGALAGQLLTRPMGYHLPYRPWLLLADIVAALVGAVAGMFFRHAAAKIHSGE